jgi:hypothetical protein
MWRLCKGNERQVYLVSFLVYSRTSQARLVGTETAHQNGIEVGWFDDLGQYINGLYLFISFKLSL